MRHSLASCEAYHYLIRGRALPPAGEVVPLPATRLLPQFGQLVQRLDRCHVVHVEQLKLLNHRIGRGFEEGQLHRRRYLPE